MGKAGKKYVSHITNRRRTYVMSYTNKKNKINKCYNNVYVYFYRVKSDKINILRKQYDAFLEEDKKRKQRNEFILGRLEDMRYSNKVPIPVHDQVIKRFFTTNTIRI